MEPIKPGMTRRVECLSNKFQPKAEGFFVLCVRTPQLPTLIIIMCYQANVIELVLSRWKLRLSRRLPGRRWGHYWLSSRQPLNPSLGPWQSTRGHTHFCKNAITCMISIRLPYGWQVVLVAVSVSQLDSHWCPRWPPDNLRDVALSVPLILSRQLLIGW